MTKLNLRIWFGRLPEIFKRKGNEPLPQVNNSIYERKIKMENVDKQVMKIFDTEWRIFNRNVFTQVEDLLNEEGVGDLGTIIRRGPQLLRPLLRPVRIVLDNEDVMRSRVAVPVQPTKGVPYHIDISGGVGGNSISIIT